jgi:hypothetical protein
MKTPEIYGIMITNSISPMQKHFESEYLHFRDYKYGLDSHSLKRIRPSFDFDLVVHLNLPPSCQMRPKISNLCRDFN